MPRLRATNDVYYRSEKGQKMVQQINQQQAESRLAVREPYAPPKATLVRLRIEERLLACAKPYHHHCGQAQKC
jgi:hypothetical protein